MPIKGATYRMKGDVRLAFVKGKVVEAKNMKTGDMSRTMVKTKTKKKK